MPASPDKSIDKTVALPGADAKFDILVEVPGDSLPWHHVVITDQVDSWFAIRGVSASQGEVFRVGQLVTAALGIIPTDGHATVEIEITVRDNAPCGLACPNTAIVFADNFTETKTSPPVTLTVGIPLYLPLVMKGYSAP